MIMSFELVNAPATFQAYINWALAGFVDVFCVVYLDDILIYFNSLNEHWGHVLQVLEWLHQFQLYANSKKCEFSITEVEFLRFIISVTGVLMNSH